ncbi:hypothetical protein C8Q74DRAFT_743393 [Fomes fomentarius]|nr:hypothetical protein C8Q74DRAFT_743393 [Fomes fomentarius]
MRPGLMVAVCMCTTLIHSTPGLAVGSSYGTTELAADTRLAGCKLVFTLVLCGSLGTPCPLSRPATSEGLFSTVRATHTPDNGDGVSHLFTSVSVYSTSRAPFARQCQLVSRPHPSSTSTA